MREEFKKGFQALEKIENRTHDSFHWFMNLLDLIDECENKEVKDCIIHELVCKITIIKQSTADFEEQLEKIKTNIEGEN